MKPKIVHLIFSLGNGGAENLLMQTLPMLEEYDNYIITFSDKNNFNNNIYLKNLIQLNTPKIWQWPLACLRLKKIIKNLKPSLIHSHLTIANIVARFSTPRNVPVLTSIHNSVRYNIEFKKWYIRKLEKLSLKYRPCHLIFVSDTVKQDYISFLREQPKRSSVIFNFVDTGKFKPISKQSNVTNSFKIISVGSLSHQKNFEFLVRAFSKADIKDAELHIYGDGPLRAKIESLIEDKNSQIRLMGSVSKIEKLIGNYNLYVSSSLYEGLSLSVLEAMATGVPLLLTNIPSFIEQCGDSAVFYELNNETDFVNKLKTARKQPELLHANVEKCQEKINNVYGSKRYLDQLKTLYNSSIQNNQ